MTKELTTRAELAKRLKKPITDIDAVAEVFGDKDKKEFSEAQCGAVESVLTIAETDKVDIKTAYQKWKDSQAIAQSQPSAIANQKPSPSPQTIVGPLEDEGRDAANNVIGQIGQYSSEAKSDIEQGLEAFVKGSIYAGAQKTFDSPEWQQAALEAIRGGKSQP